MVKRVGNVYSTSEISECHLHRARPFDRVQGRLFAKDAKNGAPASLALQARSKAWATPPIEHQPGDSGTGSQQRCGPIIRTMMPPEIILDRYIRENFPKSYSGKLDIERVRSPSLRTFLYGLQIETNDALRLENANASGGIAHPPFHFDYLDATVTNAHAIRHESFWFIALTLPLIKCVVDVSRYLSRSPIVLQLLRLDTRALQPDILWGYLGQIQLIFLTSHEYTDLIHQHSARKKLSVMWTEFVPQSNCGGIDSQVEELDADGYATYLVLTFLLRSERRERALIQLGQTDMPSADCDELILSCFFLAMMALFRTYGPRASGCPSISPRILRHQ